MQNKLLKRLIWGLVGGIVLLLIVFSVADEMPDLSDYGSKWQLATQGIAGFVILSSMAMALRAIRYVRLVGPVLPAYRTRLYVAFPWLFAASGMLPMRSGEAVRAAWVKKLKVNLSSSVPAAILERIGDIVILAAFVLVALPFILVDLPLWLKAGCIAAAIFGCLAFIFTHPLAEIICNRILPEEPKSKVVHWLKEALLQMLAVSTIGAATRTLLISLLIWICVATGLGSLLTSMDPTTSIATVMLFAAGVNFASLLTLLPGNVGSYHLAGAAVLMLAGHTEPDSIAATVIVHAVMISFVLCAAILSFLVEQFLPKPSEPTTE